MVHMAPNTILAALCTAALLWLSLASTAVAAKPRELMWDQLVPESERFPPPSALPDAMPDTMSPEEESLGGWTYGTEPVMELDGELVKIPGFIVPLESDEGGLLDEFLLVPYFGACIHVPPPPPNQIIYVKLAKPYELTNMWDPFWITGIMTTKPWLGDFAQTVYQLSADKVEKYEY